MKLIILLLPVSFALLSGCTTAYKTGQTPDDVYYSPTRENEVYASNETEDERYSDEYYEDRYLRMKVRNHRRWSDLDDWYYADYRNRHNVYLGCCFCKNTWSPYNYWNTYHNPYYNNYVIIKDVRTPVYNKPRTFNLNSYNPAQSNTRTFNNTKVNGTSTNQTYRPSTSNNESGSRLREVFRSSNNNSGSSGSTPKNNSSSSGSSGGSKPSGSGSAPVRRF